MNKELLTYLITDSFFLSFPLPGTADAVRSHWRLQALKITISKNPWSASSAIVWTLKTTIQWQDWQSLGLGHSSCSELAIQPVLLIFKKYILWSTRLSACLSVCEHISGTAGPIGTKFCVQIPCGDGSVLLRRRCAALCTSGFMDDVTFGRNGREAGKGWQHSASAINYVRDRGGVWCLWMLVFFTIFSVGTVAEVQSWSQTVTDYRRRDREAECLMLCRWADW